MKRKVIMTCAVTGSAPVNPKHPAFPITPEEICNSVIESAKAGASAVHVHVRDPKTGAPSHDPALYRELVDRIRQSGTNIIINVTCGGGGNFFPDPANEGRALPESEIFTPSERVRHIEQTLPEICSLDVTTFNEVFGNKEVVYLNTPRTLRAMAKRFQELGVKPELEVFQPGDILLAKQMIEEGLIDTPPMFQMVLGVKWAAPADPETMIYMRNLLPKSAIWGGFGIAQMEMPMVAQSVLLGGNVRVGLEDNLYLERGVFATNGQLVEKARKIIECMGYEVATPDDARSMLELKTPQ